MLLPHPCYGISPAWTICSSVCVGSSDMCGQLGWCSVALGCAWHYSGCWTNGHLPDSSTGVGQSAEFRPNQITLHFYVAVDIHLSLCHTHKDQL